MKISSLLIGGGTLAGAYFAVRYLFLQRLNSEIQAVTSVNINKVSLTSLELKIDVLLKNPTGGTITVKYPFVKILYGNTVLGSSEVKDKDFPLPAYSQMSIDTIYLPINLLTLLSVGPKLIIDLQSGNAVAIQAITVTTLNGSIPYTRTDNFNLKQAK